jgi:hypothetical protein
MDPTASVFVRHRTCEATWEVIRSRGNSSTLRAGAISLLTDVRDTPLPSGTHLRLTLATRHSPFRGRYRPGMHKVRVLQWSGVMGVRAGDLGGGPFRPAIPAPGSSSNDSFGTPTPLHPIEPSLAAAATPAEARRRGKVSRQIGPAHQDKWRRRVDRVWVTTQRGVSDPGAQSKAPREDGAGVAHAPSSPAPPQRPGHERAAHYAALRERHSTRQHLNPQAVAALGLRGLSRQGIRASM